MDSKVQNLYVNTETEKAGNHIKRVISHVCYQEERLTSKSLQTNIQIFFSKLSDILLGGRRGSYPKHISGG